MGAPSAASLRPAHLVARGTQQGHLPQLPPECEEVGSIVNGPGRHPLGPVAKLVEAVVDVSDQLPAERELSLDVRREEVLTGGERKRGTWVCSTFQTRGAAGDTATRPTEWAEQP